VHATTVQQGRLVARASSSGGNRRGLYPAPPTAESRPNARFAGLAGLALRL